MQAESDARRNGHANGHGLPSYLHSAVRLPGDRYAALRRAADLVVAAALLVLTAPFVLLAAVLVKLTSRGPVLYTQTRVGLHGLPFTIYKLRTMQHDCERHGGAQWSKPGDPRVTPVGRILRKLHVDEMPQLWNVVKGDMALVGPRPERPEFVPQLERVLPCYRQRLLVRPGLTGLAQVQLPPDTDLESVRRKLACDLYYVRNYGFWLDVQVSLATIGYLLRVPFAVSRRLWGVPSGDVVEGTYRVLAVVPPNGLHTDKHPLVANLHP